MTSQNAWNVQELITNVQLLRRPLLAGYGVTSEFWASTECTDKDAITSTYHVVQYNATWVAGRGVQKRSTPFTLAGNGACVGVMYACDGVSQQLRNEKYQRANKTPGSATFCFPEPNV